MGLVWRLTPRTLNGTNLTPFFPPDTKYAGCSLYCASSASQQALCVDSFISLVCFSRSVVCLFVLYLFLFAFLRPSAWFALSTPPSPVPRPRMHLFVVN